MSYVCTKVTSFSIVSTSIPNMGSMPRCTSPMVFIAPASFTPSDFSRVMVARCGPSSLMLVPYTCQPSSIVPLKETSSWPLSLIFWATVNFTGSAICAIQPRAPIIIINKV